MLKAFVLLRLPISFLCLGGFADAVASLGDINKLLLGSLFVVGLYVFMVVASIRLAWRRRGGLHLAGLLLAFEVVGLFLLGVDLGAATPSLGNAVSWGFTVLLLWALPNAAILYKARSLFSKPETKKPGD